MEEVDVRAVTADLDQARISVIDIQDQPGIAATLFGALADREINVDMIIQSSAARKDAQNDISFTVSKDDFSEALEAVETVIESIGGQGVTTDEHIAKVSVVGTGMRTHPGVAKRVFETLGEMDINIEMISTSEIKISVVIDEDDVDRALNLLHDAFELHARTGVSHGPDRPGGEGA